ncbi:DUF4835 family protein [Paracrocinitomix mangrovi]|uniref:type IX secretion system protein PorD n=1 Tax=Paracrocinitomix mangrovi TaxID=2862509 RepID=UPI001C8CF89B|nr:DUF4835 family protein [Paracrocinitomix mangrovi]UKN01273.1 DUF4835 family protein [Paracrocinitomix mangrovi]
MIILTIVLGTKAVAQELNCEVSVINTPSLQVGPVEKEVFTELQGAIYDFMNNTRWTNDVFEIEERINMSILITITDIPSTTTYEGKIQVQSTRPVYNTAYNTNLFNFVDNNFKIDYARNTALLFSIDQHRSNLTSILAFYAYMVLAYDYDSFSPEGGTPYFTKAQIIANNAKNSGDPGWLPSGKKNNRYWMVDNALQSVFKPLRTTYYNYHRKGFDVMYNNLAGGRAEVLTCMESLIPIQRSRPGSLNLQMFLTAKSQELIDLFSQAEISEKNKAVSALKRLDPANSSKYQEILN